MNTVLYSLLTFEIELKVIFNVSPNALFVGRVNSATHPTGDHAPFLFRERAKL